MVTEKRIKELVKERTNYSLSEHLYKSISRTLFDYFTKENSKEKRLELIKKQMEMKDISFNKTHNKDILSFFDRDNFKTLEKIYIKDLRKKFISEFYDIEPTSFSKQLFKILRHKNIIFERGVDQKGRYFVI